MLTNERWSKIMNNVSFTGQIERRPGLCWENWNPPTTHFGYRADVITYVIHQRKDPNKIAKRFQKIS